MEMTCSTCLYNCAVRLTGPVWGPICCAGNVGCMCLSCVGTTLGVICCCSYEDYQQGTKDDQCTLRGPSKATWDAWAVSILRASSFAPTMDATIYRDHAVKKMGTNSGFLAQGPDSWTAHQTACGNTATIVSFCATVCGIFSAPCSCCPPERTPCGVVITTHLIGDLQNAQPGGATTTQPLITDQPT